MRIRPFFLASVVLSTACAAAVIACGDDDNEGRTGVDGGGSDAPSDGSSGGGAKQKGKIVVALQDVPLPGATVTIGSSTATTDNDGNYEIGFTKGAPIQMQVAADDYYKLYEQEYVVDKDAYDRGSTSLLAKSVAGTLLSFLQGRDASKGLLVVRVQPHAPCDSEEGATVALDPPGSSMVRYIQNGTPSNTRANVKKGESFSAVIYNIDPGADVKVKVDSPTCKQEAFPVVDGDVTYTGQHQKIEAGEVLSFMRVYLKDANTAADAGSDADASDAAGE